MLAADIDLQSLDGEHWRNWMHLLVPPGVLHAPRFAVLIIDAHGMVLSAVISGQGAVPPSEVPFAGTSPPDLASLRESLEVGAVVVLAADAVAQLHGIVERQLDLDQD